MNPLEEIITTEETAEVLEIIQEPKKTLWQKIRPYVLSAAIPLLMGVSYGAGTLEEKKQDTTNVQQDTLATTPLQTKYDSLEKAHQALQLKYEITQAALKEKNIMNNNKQPPIAIDTINIPQGQYFIEVDKPEQRVRVWQKTNYTLVAEAPTSTGTNKGEKTKQGDNKTPAGYTTITSKENSNYWLYDGQPAYGPWFFRLNFGSWNNKGEYNPAGHCSIGIHGTNEPQYLGTEQSHGCIRLQNNFLEEATKKEYLTPGNPVFIVPYNDSIAEQTVAGLGQQRIRKVSEKGLVNLNNKLTNNKKQ